MRYLFAKNLFRANTFGNWGAFLAFSLLLSCHTHQRGITKAGQKGSFSIGLIADCQYCSDPGQGVRKYAASRDKLTACIKHFNQMDLTYVIHLGDFIDRDYESFSQVIPIYQSLTAPGYHVLGNHDFSVADEFKSEIPKLLGLKARYYHFATKGWRFISLDGNDISFHAYPEDSPQYRIAETYYQDHQVTSPKWNGALSSHQLIWLEEVLKSAEKKNEMVVIYCHFPVYPENEHNLWNAPEVVQLIDQYPCVKAYINGHNHAGNYALNHGVHYLTLQGMVDTEETSYARIDVRADRLEVIGYGREENRVLKIMR